MGDLPRDQFGTPRHGIHPARDIEISRPRLAQDLEEAQGLAPMLGMVLGRGPVEGGEGEPLAMGLIQEPGEVTRQGRRRRLPREMRHQGRHLPHQPG